MDFKQAIVQPNNAHAHRPPRSHLLAFKGYLRRVMGRVSLPGWLGQFLTVIRGKAIASLISQSIAPLISQSDRLFHPIKNPSKDPRS